MQKKIVNLFDNIKETIVILLLLFFIVSQTDLFPYEIKNQLVSLLGWGALIVGSLTVFYWFYSAAKHGFKSFLLLFIWLSSILGTCIGLGFLALWGVGANTTNNHLYIGLLFFIASFSTVLYIVYKRM